MKDEPKPPTPDSRLLTPGSLWNDLVAAEAGAAVNGSPGAGGTPLLVVQEIDQDQHNLIREHQHFLLRAPDGQQTLYHRADVYDEAVHAAYITGIKHERLYQLNRLAKQRELRSLAIGAAAFFGVCAGMILAAVMNWAAR